ncbi:triosephosphate isomerase [Pelagophyceae sp. CCMP2097]|nr:triosephosphate isomerase [Pelagophyceae sp. CCMP2097]|mmetsp:Transcript_29689/g.99980  ORF Transcript_29689/g.99980 Transcript_29689/m.99980 type:complete len:282 (+) Transcript_29689:74-919(+)
MRRVVAALLALAVRRVASLRTPIIAGNWKMNPATLADARLLASKLAVEGAAEVVIFPPTPFMSAVADCLSVSGEPVDFGAQDAYCVADKGAFTGAVSCPQLKSVGCAYVLCGHSERRTEKGDDADDSYGDSDFDVNVKVARTLAAGLKAMVCVGESVEEKDQGITADVCRLQLTKALFGVEEQAMQNVVVAYEPIWATGTGVLCPSRDAQAVHAYLRQSLAGLYGANVARETRILYGGSVTPDNVDDIMARADIDGVLVGGASLDAAAFNKIVAFTPTQSS